MFELISQWAPKIRELVNNSNRVLVNIHAGADYDSIGGALGLKAILAALGKQVDVYSPEQIDSEVTSKSGLLEGFPGIIYGNFLDLDLSRYDLFVCLDCENPRRISRNENIKFPLSIPTVVIDHHQHNTGFGNVNLILSDTCTSEIVYILAKSNSWPIPAPAATNLFIGIWSDTGQFMYPGTTTSATFISAAELIQISQMNVTNTIWQLRSQDWRIIMAASAIINKGKLYFKGKVFYSSIKPEDLSKFGLDISSIDPVKEYVCHTMSYTRGPSVIAIIYWKGNENYKLSLRSNNLSDLRDVSLIAQQIEFGGGHPRAAGATLKMDINSAHKFLLEKIQEVYPELGEA